MSENIPYIIAEDGYYYVAYKEKAPVPEIVVSSKGVANGLSEEYNDGWDFGPDSYDPTSTANPPYTQTTGTLEAFNYSTANAMAYSGIYIFPTVRILDGIFNVSEPLTFGIGSLPTSGNYSVNIIGNGYTNSHIHWIGSTSPQAILTIDPNINNIYIANLNPGVASNATGSPSYGIYWDSAKGFADNGITIENMTFGMTSSGLSMYINNAFVTYFKNLVSPTGMTVYGSGSSSRLILQSNEWATGNVTVGNFNYMDISDLSAHITIGSNGTSFTVDTITIRSSSVNIIVNSPVNNLQILNSVLSGNTSGTGAFEVNASIGILDVESCSISGGFLYATSSNSQTIDSLIINGLVNIDIVSPFFGDNPSYITVNNYDIRNINAGTFSGALPVNTPTLSVNPPVSAKVYQNTNPYAIEIDLPVYASTSGTAGYVTVAKGSTDTPTAIANQYISGDTSSSAVDIVRLRVPAGWYYEFTGSSVTFTTASVFAE